MKCEPLRNKKHEMKKDILASKDHKERNEFYLGFEKGVDDSFDVFASFFDLSAHCLFVFHFQEKVRKPN